METNTSICGEIYTERHWSQGETWRETGKRWVETGTDKERQQETQRGDRGKERRQKEEIGGEKEGTEGEARRNRKDEEREKQGEK